MSGEGRGGFTVGDGRSWWDGWSYMLAFTMFTVPPDAKPNPLPSRQSTIVGGCYTNSSKILAEAKVAAGAIK